MTRDRANEAGRDRVAHGMPAAARAPGTIAPLALGLAPARPTPPVERGYFERRLGASEMPGASVSTSPQSFRAAGSGPTTAGTAAGYPVLQRKAACGGSDGCAACAEEDRLLQAKANVSDPADSYEQEADRFADRATAGTAPQRMDGATDISRLSGRTPPTSVTGARAVHAADTATGQPLEPDIRRNMEGRFGRDFSAVRVHTDSRSADAARAVNARAYTVGREIVFDRGNYAPGSSAGMRLLAHELTHVVQQAGASGMALQRDATDDLAETMARDLDNYVAANAKPYAHILDFFGKISSDIEDNVAAAFTKLQSAATLERFAGDALGRLVLDVLSEAMITGSVSLFESEQAERILVAKRRWVAADAYSEQAERIAALRHKARPALSEEQQIAQLAEDLRVYLAADHYGRVTKAFDDIPSSIEDNVAGAIVELLPDARLEQIAGDRDGRVMLDVLYDAMITGHVTAFEALQSERILLAKARHATPAEYVAEAERIAGLRNKAEDSAPDLAIDNAARTLARVLSGYLAEKRYAEAKRRIADLSSGVEDNVASHLVELQPPARLDEIAADAVGRQLLDVLYEAIITGSVSDFERLQANRIVEAKGKAKPPVGQEEYVKTLAQRPLYILPLRMQTTFRSNYAIFKATRQDDGRIKVQYDDEIHFWDSDMFKADQENIPPYRIASVGFFLDPDEVVWLKLYDEGEKLIPVQAIELIDYANQAKRKSVSVGVSAFETGLFLGYGGLAAFSGEGVGAMAARVELGEASVAGLRLAQGVLWADRVAMALPLISLVVNENRDWILEKFPKAGPVLLTALDQANRIAGYYGWARMGVDAARYLKSRLEPALVTWRAEKAAAGDLTSSQRHALDEIEANLKVVEDDLAKTEAEAAAEAVKQVEQHPELTDRAPPGERRAKVGEHEVVEVKESGGAVHCEFHSNGGPEVPCPADWTADQPQPARREGEPTQAEPSKPAEEPATPAANVAPPAEERLPPVEPDARGVPRQIWRQVEEPVGPAYASFEEAFAARSHPDAHITENILRDQAGREIARWWEVSESLAARDIHGVGQLGHTEQKALTRIRFEPGMTLEINGQHAPCSFTGGCAVTLQGVATTNGVTIVYRTINGQVYQYPNREF